MLLNTALKCRISSRGRGSKPPAIGLQIDARQLRLIIGLESAQRGTAQMRAHGEATRIRVDGRTACVFLM